MSDPAYELIGEERIMPEQWFRRREIPQRGMARLAFDLLLDSVEIATGRREFVGVMIDVDKEFRTAAFRRLDEATRRKQMGEWRAIRTRASRIYELRFLASPWCSFWCAVAGIDGEWLRDWARRKLETA